MQYNKWTAGLLAGGVVGLGFVAWADEGPITSLVSGTTIGGAVDTSVQWKLGPGSTMANRFINTAPDHYNGFNLEFFEFRLEKPLEDGQWSAGYQAEMWFGPDANALPGSLSEGVAVKQAYVALRAPVGNGLDFKMGQFDSIIGYEVAASYDNPNFSRSLGFYLEPLSHTGMLASYQVTEWLGVAGGIADTAFGKINAKNPWAYEPDSLQTKGDGTLTYLGAVSLKAPENWGWFAGSSLYGGLVIGGMSNEDDSVNYYVGFSMPTPLRQVTIGVAWDYLSHIPGFGDDTLATVVAGYVSWQITEKLTANARVEWAEADRAIWIIPVYGADGGGDYDYLYEERLFAVTATIDYSLWKNVVSRVEMVWDHDLSGNYSFDGDSNAWLLLANIAYKF